MIATDDGACPYTLYSYAVMYLSMCIFSHLEYTHAKLLQVAMQCRVSVSVVTCSVVFLRVTWNVCLHASLMVHPTSSQHDFLTMTLYECLGNRWIPHPTVLLK